MDAGDSKSNKIGAGRHLASRLERKFKRGSLIFIEGELSTEMFIIQSGKVRILKQEGESTIELAILGPGSVLGELSLLDHQPRSATAQVVEDVTTSVIDEELLRATLEKVPSWLSNIIQLVVKRLRDTMKRTSEDVVRHSVAGVIRVVLLALGAGLDQGSRPKLAKIKELVYSTIGLGDVETEDVFLHLIMKDLAVIRKDDYGQEFLVVKNREILQLYMSYLRAEQQGTKLVGADFTPATVQLIGVIIAAGEKSGKKVQEKLVRIEAPQIELELDRAGLGQHIDPDSMDQLIAAKVVAQEQSTVQSAHGSHKRLVYMYNVDTLKRVLMLREWMPTFTEEIKF
jgi:CRP-like cAMP-binding protein